MRVPEFIETMAQPLALGESALDRIQSLGRRIQGGKPFVDDFSILEVVLR